MVLQNKHLDEPLSLTIPCRNNYMRRLISKIHTIAKSAVSERMGAILSRVLCSTIEPSSSKTKPLM